MSGCGLAGLIKSNDTSVGRLTGKSEHQSKSGASLSLSAASTSALGPW